MADTVVAKAEVQDNVVPRQVFVSYIKKQMRDQSGLIALPFCISLLFLFTCMVVSHERSVDRQSIRSAVREDILENCNYDYLNATVGFKNMDNVNTPAAVIDWLRLGFFPHIIWPSQYSPLDENGDITGKYLQYNQVIGGVRLMSQGFAESTDQCSDLIATQLDTPCMHRTTNDRTAEGYDDLAFAPDGEETTDWSAGPDFETKGESDMQVEWFMLVEGMAQHRQKLYELLNPTDESEPFINRRVRQVMASIIMFNADLRLVILVESNFFFSRTGRVWPLLRIKTIDPDPFNQHFPVQLFDILFLVLLVLNFFRDFFTLVSFARKVGPASLNLHLPHGLIWYALDLVGLTCGIVLAACYAYFYYGAVAIEDDLIDNYQEMTQNMDRLSDFFTDVEEIAHRRIISYRSVLLVYPISLLLRLGLGFSGQPRMSMVAKTIMTAYTDMYHYLIVFMAFLLCCTCFAMTLLGREMEQFSTMSRAMQTCIRMLFGDVDWEDMLKAGFVKGMIFFWIFHILLVMVMFNILLGIIVDAYEDTRESVGKSPKTLGEQFMETTQRMRLEWGGKSVRIYNIWEACYDTYGNDLMSGDDLTLQELLKITPKLSEDQAQALIDGAKATLETDQEQAADASVLDALARTTRNAVALSEALGANGGGKAPKKRPAIVVKASDAGRAGGPSKVTLPAEVADFKDAKLDPALADLQGALKLTEFVAERSGDSSAAVAQAVRLALALAEGTPGVSANVVGVATDLKAPVEVSTPRVGKGGVCGYTGC